MILSIDTTNNLKTIVKLGNTTLIKKSLKPGDQDLLTAIDELLKRNNTLINQITQIKVNIGPGSYTGTRVGVAVANTLAWGLNIRVNGKTRVFPKY